MQPGPPRKKSKTIRKKQDSVTNGLGLRGARHIQVAGESRHALHRHPC